MYDGLADAAKKRPGYGYSCDMRAYVGGAGKPVVMSVWVCSACDVEGRDLDVAPTCWNCGVQVKVIARPTVMR
jgi:hypothetical protein